MDKPTDHFSASYIETALWSSTDEEGTNLDSSKYADVKFSQEAIERIQVDCVRFQDAANPLIGAFKRETDGSILNSINLSKNRVAHDFWLTRNRHGAGFWDGDYPEPLAKQLTDLAHSFDECDIYVGDDGRFHIA